MSPVFDPEIGRLEGALGKAAQIQEIISQNIANASTPGYTALKFDDVLGKAVERMDKPKVTLEDEMAQLAKNSIEYTAYSKLLISKLSAIRTVATQGRK